MLDSVILIPNYIMSFCTYVWQETNSINPTLTSHNETNLLAADGPVPVSGHQQ